MLEHYKKGEIIFWENIRTADLRDPDPSAGYSV